jgi:acetyl esterase/lipase
MYPKNTRYLILLSLTVCFVHIQISFAQQFIPIWPEGKMPNSKGLQLKDNIANERIYQVGTPGMYAFFPGKAENKGTAVVICPGGGYERLAYIISGFQLAKWFNTLGISAFVLNYRLPNSPDLQQREIGPLQDGQRAIRYIKAHANEWGVDTSRIGVQGSSAGGHLASMLGTSMEDVSGIHDEMDGYSFRPAFMILVSPVIDLGEYAHAGSRKNLLGPNASDEMIKKYSTQNLVSTSTVPAFIVGAFDDKAVPAMNGLLFYKALLAHGISTSFHVFPQGGHSIALRNNPGSTQMWTSLCEAWLLEKGFLPELKTK